MSPTDFPTLELAIDCLSNQHDGEPNRYAIWVTQAPFRDCYTLRDCTLTDDLMQAMQAWQEIFTTRELPKVPHIPSSFVPQMVMTTPSSGEVDGPQLNYTGRLMQNLGIHLWKWIFSGEIQNSFAKSQGIAFGQSMPMRLRLDIRDPNLTALPWEIMQAQAGVQAVSLSQNMLFSRLTSAVDPLQTRPLDRELRILLVLGHDHDVTAKQAAILSLEQEASMLKQLLEHHTQIPGESFFTDAVPCQVDTLVEPSVAKLTEYLERGRYNIFFYAGHGMPAADGGLLFLQANSTLNGTELAQVLTRCQVKLAVFNACWGAIPDRNRENQQAIPRSSLAEVLIHQGVPAVVGMRDAIADQEALSFIQMFAQSLAKRYTVDQAMAIARQHLLTLYRFNHPAWTLPVLYMHPEFDGQLVVPATRADEPTRIPFDSPTSINHRQSRAWVRLVGNRNKVWTVHGGQMQIGRRPENDLVIDDEQWVSRQHAEIFYRHNNTNAQGQATYFIRDFSNYGTYIRSPKGWQRIHRQEVVLPSGSQLKFGSSQGKVWEFVIEEE